MTSTFRYLFPLNTFEGVHVDFQRLLDWTLPESIDDFQDKIKRFKAFNVQAQQIIQLLRKAVEEQMTHHQLSMVK